MLKYIKHSIRLATYTLHNKLTKCKRSTQWPHVERSFLATNPTCAACGGVEKLNVHHQKPFHLHPELELDTTNLITLCMALDRHCHYVFGHGASGWKGYVPAVAKLASLALATPTDREALAKEAKDSVKYE